MFADLRRRLRDDEIFRAEHYVPEPPPRPREIIGTIAVVLAVLLYMACVISLLAMTLGQ
jgi:hypothetical protein